MGGCIPRFAFAWRGSARVLCDNIMASWSNPLDLAASAGQRGRMVAVVLALLWGAVFWAMSA
jgi:hypothetical protein